MEGTATRHRPAPTRSPAAVAREVLRAHWNGRLPVNPHQIARDMGIKLVPVSASALSGCGRYRGEVEGVPVIEHSTAEPAERTRFTVAHEIGHHALGHGPRPCDGPSSFRASVPDPCEHAANQFAAELLVPSDALRTLVLSGRFRSVDELACAFAVSQLLASIRVNALAL